MPNSFKYEWYEFLQTGNLNAHFLLRATVLKKTLNMLQVENGAAMDGD